MGLISRVSSRTYRGVSLKMLNLLRFNLQKIQHVSSQPLCTSAPLTKMYSNGHFQSVHMNLMLESEMSPLTRIDYLGRQFSKTRYGKVNTHHGKDKGSIIKFMIKKPQKPNSANRRFAKVKLVSGERVVQAKIPGEGHNLTEHSKISLLARRTKDVPGSHYKLQRGAYDFKMYQPGKK